MMYSSGLRASCPLPMMSCRSKMRLRGGEGQGDEAYGLLMAGRVGGGAGGARSFRLRAL